MPLLFIGAMAKTIGQTPLSNLSPGLGAIKAKECKARLTMLVPFTPSALWWHLITPDGEKFSSHVHAFRVIPRAPDLFLAGRMGYKSNKRTPRWDSLALQLDFSRRIRHCLSIPHDH